MSRFLPSDLARLNHEMLTQANPITPELRLLFACAKVLTTQEDEAAIRQMLDEGIDWTLFAQKAIDGGLASLAGHTLVRVAPDLVPDDILDALRVIIGHTRERNRVLFDELTRMIEARPLKDPLAFQNAYAAANGALAVNPNDADALRHLGHVLSDLGRRKEAVACFERAIALMPDNAVGWKDCGTAMLSIGQAKAALSYIDKALALEPQDADAWTIRARVLSQLQRYTEAVEASDRALAIDPEHVLAMYMGIRCRIFSYDWSRREDDKRRITAGLKAGQPIVSPDNHRLICDSEEENLVATRLHAKRFPPSAKPLWQGERYRHDKIRIAYKSTDFRIHPVASLLVGCFEHHDKTRFETTAISLYPSDGSEMRKRIEAAFDHFIDVQTMNDAEIAKMMREMEVDIAIDLNGYASHAGTGRMGILAHRPAPVQVNYLGYPGTLGVPFIDYIIADQVVIPDEHQIHYSEKVVYLPHTFLPNDRKRRASERTPTRAELGLPETGFVFACFNNTYKIGPEMFDTWMRLLREVKGSVLWLLEDRPIAAVNLRHEAQARGVAPERLVFASWVPRSEDHIARLHLADLFLDTLPYNAHATANDALWAGLPVLTCLGNTFPSRVAASLLKAIGLPQLVTDSLVGYEELALALARNPERLAAIRAKLVRNRDTEPLFDTARFTRDLESAYTMMWERQQSGLPPASFVVANVH